MRSKKFSTRKVATLVVFTACLLVMATRLGAQQERVLHSFSRGVDGYYPYAGLVFDSAGNLYGTTSQGGIYGDGLTGGTVFEMSRTAAGAWTHKTLHNFRVTGGGSPYAGLIAEASGSLLGVAADGPWYGLSGTAFELTPAADGTWTDSVLYTFQRNGLDGYDPVAGLILDSAGSLYGTTIGGGPFLDGVVFELMPAAGGGWTHKVLHNFNHSGGDGANPDAGLIFDRGGNLYGTTLNGGAYNYGTVFELMPQAGGRWVERILYHFNNNGGDGYNPAAGLIFDAAGNLYGTTSYGGIYNAGTVFELTPKVGRGWAERVLHHFGAGQDGQHPFAGLIFDASGDLYGTTVNGGVYGYGTAFELRPTADGGWTESMLHNFNIDYIDGIWPYSSLIFDASGNLYGTTSWGGTSDYGTVFEITP
jgi:uncharacterized repeat protein (TIGR03803 family)